MRLFILSCLAVTLAQATEAGPLDGKTLTATFIAEGQGGGSESLCFAAGLLDAPTIREHFGFAATAYTAVKEQDGLHASATFTSAEHGQVVITMIINPKDLSVAGQRTWSKPGKKPIVHPFTGTLTNTPPGKNDPGLHRAL
jgi:hypothetical protein